MKIKTVLLCILLSSFVYGQNTVGTLLFDEESYAQGYNLLFPENQSKVFLTDICGQIVHQWDMGDMLPGKELYIDEESNLLVALLDPNLTQASFGTGGAGGVIEKRSWENELIWRIEIRDSIYRLHHDIEWMPNGNVLMIVWHRKFLPELIEYGFDTSRYTQKALWADAIMEYSPELDSIVWVWDAWDHIVQDYDSTKAFFGAVAQNPGKIDINYQDFTFQKPDWLHINGIDYNPQLDQIIISPKNFNELWIIDHSISSDTARTEKGDLLYRWGNPQAYKQGTKDDQILFSQHDPSWIDMPGSAYDGQILVYNNFIAFDLSLGEIIHPNYDTQTGTYTLQNGRYLPLAVTRSISHPDTIKNFSTAGSTIQLLPNGNFLMHAARPGFAFELTDDETVVWEYKVPFRNGFPVMQGTELSLSQNFTFSLRRYPQDYPAFIGKDLSPKGYIELNPNLDFCKSIIDDTHEPEQAEWVIAPNPVSDMLYLDIQSAAILKVYDTKAVLIKKYALTAGSNMLDLSSLPQGIYVLHLEGRLPQKMIILR